jgi:hypothetical protein
VRKMSETLTVEKSEWERQRENYFNNPDLFLLVLRAWQAELNAVRLDNEMKRHLGYYQVDSEIRLMLDVGERKREKNLIGIIGENLIFIGFGAGFKCRVGIEGLSESSYPGNLSLLLEKEQVVLDNGDVLLEFLSDGQKEPIILKIREIENLEFIKEE